MKQLPCVDNCFRCLRAFWREELRQIYCSAECRRLWAQENAEPKRRTVAAARAARWSREKETTT